MMGGLLIVHMPVCVAARGSRIQSALDLHQRETRKHTEVRETNGTLDCMALRLPVLDKQRNSEIRRQRHWYVPIYHVGNVLSGQAGRADTEVNALLAGPRQWRRPR